MYQLFDERYNVSKSQIRHGSFDLIKRIYKRELDKIVSYFSNRVFAVNSDHILCRVLNTVNVPLAYSLDRFVESSIARSIYVSKNFNFTSPINYGIIHDGLFYGKGNDEIIIYNDDYFNPNTASRDWKKIQAVKVLEHNVSNMSLLLPNGKENNIEKGLAVISINIPLLLMQYRSFILEQAIKSNNSLLSVSHFVHMYVLPNMLYSHIDIVIMNRLLNLYYGAPMGYGLKKYPFPIINYESNIDRVLLVILKHIKESGLLYENILENIPSINSDDLLEALIMPDTVKTKQVWWALLLARLKVSKFLLDVGEEKSIGNNRTLVNKIQIDLTRLLNENILKKVLTKDLYMDTIMTIDDIKKI